MEIFDEEWMSAAAAALRSLPRREGASAAIDYVIEGSPGGKIAIAVVVADGQVTALDTGRSSDPDVVVTMKYAVARALLAAETSGDAAFMRGALKVEGAHARWMLDLRPVRLAAIEALAPVMAATDG